MNNMIRHSTLSLDHHVREKVKLRKRIGLFISDDCSMTTVGVVLDAFRLANELFHAHDASSCYELMILSERGGMVDASSSFLIVTKRLDQYELTHFHALFVACPYDRLKSAYREFAAWLSHPRSVASTSIGDEFACPGGSQKLPVPMLAYEEQPPGADAIPVTPGDMVLAQIERDLGVEAARRIARALSLPIVQRDRAEVDNGGLTTKHKVCESARWIRDNYSEPISVAHAAEYAAMSKRNYQRRFKAEFGITPLEYLLRTRFEALCSMLVETELPIDKIARRCGMGDGNRLGRIFKERIGVSPTQYRAQKHIEKEGSAIEPVVRPHVPKPVAEMAGMNKASWMSDESAD